MLKIKKGLKKKIKGKKDKGKEDDLFDPEQLEKYKKELEEKRKASGEADNSEDHSGTSHQNHEQDEEWLKFQALTAGVDTILKQTTQDLGKIKESSFYQRKPTDPTNLWRPDAPSSSSQAGVAEPEAADQSGPNWVDLAEGSDTEEPTENQEKENEDPQKQFFNPEDVEPEVLDDSLFDTSYLDAIASGEIQLAYIPESPTEEDGDDPFDTSAVADVVKRIEEAEKKAARQVNLEGAVNVLSGKGAATLESKPRPRPGESSKKARPRPRAVNLLGDFESEGATGVTEATSSSAEVPIHKDIFDEIFSSPIKDGEIPLLEKFDPSNLIKSAVPNSNNKKDSPSKDKDIFKDIIGEFDVINQSIDEPLTTIHTSTTDILVSILGPPEPEQLEEDEFDAEFAALAAESIQKGPSPLPPTETVETPLEEEEEDPFDTTFVEKVAPPGKFELKLIESEVLGDEKSNEGNLDDDDDFDFNPRVGESLAPGTICPNPSPRSLLEDHSPTGEHPPAIEPHFKSGETLLDTSEQDSEIDPFDTSKVEKILPGKVELRLLEEELLKAVEHPKPTRPALPIILSARPPPNPVLDDDDDFDFDPRKYEPKEEVKAPDYLFDNPSSDDVETKVLTPTQEIQEAELDPFDTSIASSLILGPGQLELRLLESELVTSEPQQHQPIQRELSDPEFDPRGGEDPDPFIVPSNTLLKTEDIFDLDHSEDFPAAKPLTPQQESSKSIASESHGDFEDPFDTSAIEVLKLLPPSELKQIEGELLNTPAEVYQPIKPVTPTPIIVSTVEPIKETPPVRPQVQHLFETDDPLEKEIGHKPLTPAEVPHQYIDPFDTSIAEGVVPGKAEIKYLEQELGVAAGAPFDLSDNDFNPRGPQPIHPSALSFVSKTLEPQRASDQQSLSDDIDPFDTSAADNLVPTSIPTGPGKSELKALEAELLE